MMNKVLSRFGLAKNPFTKDVPVDELFEHDSSDGHSSASGQRSKAAPQRSSRASQVPARLSSCAPSRRNFPRAATV